MNQLYKSKWIIIEFGVLCFRYMNWYNKSQSSIAQPVMDAKALSKPKEKKSNSVPQQSNKVSPVSQSPCKEDDDAVSGKFLKVAIARVYFLLFLEISSMSRQQGVTKSDLFQKKNIFTIAYDDMVTQHLLPGSSDNHEDI